VLPHVPLFTHRPQVLESHTRPVLSLAICGNRLFSGSYDFSIRVWNLDTLQVRQKGLTNAIRATGWGSRKKQPCRQNTGWGLAAAPSRAPSASQALRLPQWIDSLTTVLTCLLLCPHCLCSGIRRSRGTQTQCAR